MNDNDPPILKAIKGLSTKNSGFLGAANDSDNKGKFSQKSGVMGKHFEPNIFKK